MENVHIIIIGIGIPEMNANEFYLVNEKRSENLEQKCALFVCFLFSPKILCFQGSFKSTTIQCQFA